MRFMTCGSVDDGKSTLIGRLLLDTESGLTEDQRHKLSEQTVMDLASLTDGLEAEKAQGITIDIAYRYFATAQRQFVIADCPGHEQYTRNMATAASTMDAALILVDVTKLNCQGDVVELLIQTKRHALLTHLMKVPHLIFVVNKLDAVADAKNAFCKVSKAIEKLAQDLQLSVAHIVPTSALVGTNVVTPGYTDWGQTQSLLDLLHCLPVNTAGSVDNAATILSVQYVELTKADTTVSGGSRRVFWAQLLAGSVAVGDRLIDPNGLLTTVVGLFSTTRAPIAQANISSVTNPTSVGVVLADERDLSRGDCLSSQQACSEDQIAVTVAWLDIDTAQIGRQYWLRHAHRWTKARLVGIEQVLDLKTLQQNPAGQLYANDIAQITLQLQSPLPMVSYEQNRHLGAAVLVDTSHLRTVAAVLVN
jgi:sulfate adenylyltransferase subunit 1